MSSIMLDQPVASETAMPIPAGRVISSQSVLPRLVSRSVPSRYPCDRPLAEDVGLWWVMHVRPNCEKHMASYLMTREISYYCPMYRKTMAVGALRRARVVEVPLFRGYICIALDREDHRLLYDTRKLLRVIPVEDQEAFVSELAAVETAVASGSDLLVMPGLAPGRRVIITSGPLEGLSGVVVRRDKDNRLALSVRMFNQTVLVRLDSSTGVEPL